MDAVFSALLVSFVFYAIAILADVVARRMVKTRGNKDGALVFVHSNAGSQLIAWLALAVAAGNSGEKYPGLYTALVFAVIIAFFVGVAAWKDLYDRAKRSY